MNLVLAFLASIVQGILVRIANETWDALWGQVFTSVADAEQKWAESGSGKLKREWVVNQVEAFVDAAAQKAGRPINFLERWAVRLFAGAVADALVDYVNDALGKGWADKAKELEKDLAGRLPVVE